MTKEEAIEVYNGLINTKIKEAFEFFAPELRESDDERIRKTLIEALKTSKTVGELKFTLSEPTREECIAYLEKQKGNQYFAGYAKGYSEGQKNPHQELDSEKQKEQKELPLMNGDADLYFDEWNQQKHNPTKRQCFEEGMKYAQKLQKEQIPYTDFVIKPHKGDDNNPYDMGVPEAHEYAIKRGFDIPFNYGEVYVDERHLTQTIGNILRWADEHPKEQKEQQQFISCDSIGAAILSALASGIDTDDILKARGFTYEDVEKYLISVEQKEQKPMEPLYDKEILEENLEKIENMTVKEIRQGLREGSGFFIFGDSHWAILESDKAKRDIQCNPVGWSEKHIADVFEKVGLAKIVREQGNDKLTNALQDAMLELSKVGNAEWSEIEVEFRGEKVKVKRPFFRDDKGSGYSTTEQDDWVTWDALRAWAESHGYTSFDLYPRAEWSEDDEKMLNDILGILHSTEDVALANFSEQKKWLKSLRPVKQEWSEEDEANFAWFDKFFRAESVIAGGRDIPQDKYLWFKSIRPQPKQEWSEKDKKLIDDVINSLCCYQNTLSDYQKEIVGEEIRKLKSLSPQPKPEWNEKDEKMRDRLIDRLQFITLNTRTDTTSPNITFFDEIAWLKSLRPSWKPSEEQIYSLGTVVKGYNECTVGSVGYNLKELYEQLNKLKKGKK